MSSTAGSKNQTLLLLFAWPLAVLLGEVVSRLSRGAVPAALFPPAWLGLLYWTLRDRAKAAARPAI